VLKYPILPDGFPFAVVPIAVGPQQNEASSSRCTGPNLGKRHLARFVDKEDIDGLHEIRTRRAFPQRKTFHLSDHACPAGEAAR
jgi:hypothetical protein